MEFADYNKRINSSLLWNLQFITQKLIDRKYLPYRKLLFFEVNIHIFEQKVKPFYEWI